MSPALVLSAESDVEIKFQVPETVDSMRRVLLLFSLMFLLLLSGTVGLMIIEKANLLDAFYMTVITVTTVGYGEAVPLSRLGKIFIIVYLICGIGLFTYGASLLGQWIVNAQLTLKWERRRMQNRIDQVKNHFIVCGYGRMGEIICRSLAARNQRFVVIDSNEDVLRECAYEQDWLFVMGDATNDDVLLEAGLKRAKSLATVLPTDADNLYVTLSARMLASHLQIIARASDEKAIQKLERAGASRVVSPFSSGATRMVRLMMNPTLEDFLEITSAEGDFRLAEFQVTPACPYAEKNLAETDLMNKGVMIVAIRLNSGQFRLAPSGKTQINPGDTLFAFGSEDGLAELIESQGD